MSLFLKLKKFKFLKLKNKSQNNYFYQNYLNFIKTSKISENLFLSKPQ